ncbi:HlyD family type I secretion periplasmic adaptor subunit [Shewanella sp. 1_MG-2023]|uniref:HlyD family type I secretion periplasmic adaptor subunit n=1 Tax=unclassified Shewanella TaxID=196818 RepID=UPI0026E41144|nr:MULTISPECIES: HlyD family type I secretion periplasmic adaptor subunit [unclassified Shewanella]MDO6613030.1 HlyD family type I secretion periplasmic adaptor subunit [Shewanella sp. 7_MG-2023]MDO6772898.1 HlyD family type I secretion periplasmic adaptor subunit [Shewanella sp. 2_MG-2023]MDO6796648.1 HlyD family type I secretion periplasmic adaptor subunit [Shewanella sp. 1_MG-2023]
MNAWMILKDAWQNRDKLGESNNSRDLAAFLPAALEIQETPPNPLARKLGWSLLVLLVIGIIWACLGEVNIVASAEGKIIPSSKVKQIQPLEKAVVKNILVREGQFVHHGEALIELDSTSTAADENRLTSELHSAKLSLAGSQALLSMLAKDITMKGIDSSTVIFPDVKNASPIEIDLHRRLLWQQWLQYLAQWQTLKSNLLQTQAEQAGSGEVIAKLEKILPIITKRASKMKGLHSQNYASENDYLALEQERIQFTHDLAAERQRYKQLEASEAEVRQQFHTLKAQTSVTELTKTHQLQQQISSLQEELAKAVDRNRKQILYAPVSGQVQELSIGTVGGVVTEAQQLMLIVPDEVQLDVEVFLENKDIGFVREQMLAEIKIHTFPFTKYGVIDGEVISMSDDATVDEQRGLIYGMRLKMKQSTIMVEGKEIKLMPGMAVTAEVQTGKRHIIEFFMAPLLRYRQESIRER